MIISTILEESIDSASGHTRDNDMNTYKVFYLQSSDMNTYKVFYLQSDMSDKISVCPNSMMQTGQNVLDKKWYFPIVSKLIQKLLYNAIVLALL